MRWFALWGTVVAGCFAAACCAALYSARQDAIQSAKDSTASLSFLVASHLARRIEFIDMSLQSVLADGRRAGEGWRLPASRGLGGVTVLDAAGNVVTDSPLLAERGLNFAARDYFLVHRESPDVGLYISQPFVSNVTDLFTIAISRRITRPDGGFGGIVLGMMRVATLERLFRQVDLGELGALTVLRGDGTVLARYPAAGEPAGAHRGQDALFRYYPAATSGHYEAVSPEDGVARLVGFTQVGPFPMVVTAGRAQRDIFARWNDKAAIIGLTMLASCLATIALVWILRRELRRRVEAEQTASRNEVLYKMLAENSLDTIALSDAHGRVNYISPAIQDVLGWTPAEIEGKFVRDFVHPNHLSIFDEGGYSTQSGRTLTFPAKHRSGAWVWLEARVRRLASELGEPRFISNIRDFSTRKKAEEELAAANAELLAMAATDALTGLANRRRFDETLDREWRRAARERAPLALLLIDADHFKALNDHYGHQYGDQDLRALAHIIQNCIRRPADMSARYGGEEFAVLLPKTDTEGARVIAERVRMATLAAQMPHIKSAEGVMTVSIGVCSLVPRDGLTTFDLVKRTDAALYAAKRQGRNRTCVFEPAPVPADESRRPPGAA